MQCSIFVVFLSVGVALAGAIPIPRSQINDVTNDQAKFFRAVKDGNYGLVAGLIDNGVDINALDSDGQPALNLAAANERENIVKLLVEKGVNQSVVDNKKGLLALHWAAATGNVNIARSLIQNRSSFWGYGWDNENHGVLYYAIRAGKNEMAVYLIENNENSYKLHYTPTMLLKDTPMHLAAAKKEMIYILVLMIDKGANVNVPNINFDLPLHWAARYGNTDGIAHLISNGAKVNAMNNNKDRPIHLAVMSDNHEAVEPFIRPNDLNVVNKQQRLPLHLARKAKIAALLIKAGAIGLNVGDENGDSPLTLAATRGDEEVVQFLIENGADIDFSNFDGETALHHAIINDDKAIVELLLRKGANVLLANTNDKTPEQLATDIGNKQIIELIAKYKPKA